jgi:hypothetical protein
MVKTRRFGLMHVLVIFTKAAIISGALIYLAENAGMSLVREAAGVIF